MTDLTIKVKVAYKGGDWQATSPVYSITGIGDTPDKALEDYTDQIRKLYNGEPFCIVTGKPFNVAYMMTSVSADVYLGVVQETPLTEFGINVEDAPKEEQALLEGEQIPLLEGDVVEAETIIDTSGEPAHPAKTMFVNYASALCKASDPYDERRCTNCENRSECELFNDDGGETSETPQYCGSCTQQIECDKPAYGVICDSVCSFLRGGECE